VCVSCKINLYFNCILRLLGVKLSWYVKLCPRGNVFVTRVDSDGYVNFFSGQVERWVAPTFIIYIYLILRLLLEVWC